ncbi:MAG: hypothetical protein ACE5IZ_10370 [Dehalococcoidia bacterium]
MAIERRTIVDQVEATRSGIIQLRFRKEVVEDGNVLAFEYHRTSLEPGVALATQMALVNTHLQQMGYPQVEASDVARAQTFVDAYRAAQA